MRALEAQKWGTRQRGLRTSGLQESRA